MDAFRHLIESYCALQEKGRDSRKAEIALNEGLNLTYDVLCEIEAKQNVKGKNYESLENLLCELRIYINYPLESDRRNLEYRTAELASAILAKITQRRKVFKDSKVSDDYNEERDPNVCACHMNEKELDELIEVVEQLKSLDRFRVSSFVTSIIDLRLPVTVLSVLQKADLVPVSVFIIHIIDKKEELHHFISDLISHLGKYQYSTESSLKLCETSVQLLVTLLHLGLKEEIAEPGSGAWQICTKACHDFMEQFISEISKYVLSRENCADIGKYFMQLQDHKWHIEERALQELLRLSLLALATSPCVSAEHALALQQSWLQIERPASFTAYLQSLLSTMGQDGALSVILCMIDEEEYKWQDILLFISAYLKTFPQGGGALKAFVDENLTRALTKHSRTLLACAFLLARQACLMSDVSGIKNAFSSYGIWFGSSFGVEAGSVQTSTNVAAFTFLMDFLTDLVPTDPPLCLRVHINKVPSAPPNCSHMLGDFVSLAKTRLQDLGESTGSGLFAFENTPEDDVAAALSHFESSGGHVSRVLLDSSKFRRSQYEQQFLPALLVAEQISEERTPRQLLIAKLQVSGKIPSSLLQHYEEACQRLTSQQLSSVKGNKKFRNISGSPLEKWQTVLELLVDTICHNGLNEMGDLTEEGESTFSAVAAQLKLVLLWSAEKSDLTAIYGKVVGRLFKACEICFEPPVSQDVEKSSTWLRRVVSLLNGQPALLRQFHGAVYHIACNPNLTLHETETAAALAWTLDSHEESGICLKSTAATDSDKLGESIGHTLQPTSQKGMLHALVFASTYLRLINYSSNSQVPVKLCAPSLLRTLIYLRNRLLHCSCQEVIDSCARSWSPPSSWSDLIAESQLSLAEWLDLEASVDPEDDPIKVRNFYLCEWIILHCNHNSAPELLKASLMYAGKGHAAWATELLHVIPSLVMPHDVSPAVPWLLETWMEISVRFAHQDILKAVKSLPPWMLLSNTQGTTPTSVAVSALADLLNTHLDKMFEDGFLSCQVICLVIGAVRAASPLKRGEILSKIIDSSPAFHVSLLRHGQKLQFQLTPSFTASSLLGSCLERIMKIITNSGEPEQALSSPLWEMGLVRWSLGKPLPQSDDGSLFFHLLHLGSKLLSGSVRMVMASEGPVLPSTSQMASLLVQEPLHCMKMLKDGTKIKPLSCPSVGISEHGRAGLSLATMGVMLSFHDDHLLCPGSETRKICRQVLQQCLISWKEWCRELESCDSHIQEVSFVQWLAKRVTFLVEQI